jgi:C4-dicarboxylate-specific signal transduction histidine kinase
MTKKQELSHVLINILVNARDVLGESMQKKKLITLEPYMQGDDCYINVVDNGGGIEDVIMESIFDLHFTTKKQGKGTGIGLYMSKKIANEFLNGDIVVENCNDGAKFSIILRECRGESNV